jgi:hypothetical protein
VRSLWHDFEARWVAWALLNSACLLGEGAARRALRAPVLAALRARAVWRYARVAGGVAAVYLLIVANLALLYPPPLPRTNRTSLDPHPVLIGHAASLGRYGFGGSAALLRAALAPPARYDRCAAQAGRARWRAPACACSPT